ncbi:MAG: hypothetical protein WBJ57_08450, partial [Bacillota bacterium]
CFPGNYTTRWIITNGLPAAGCPDKPNCRVFSGRIHAIITREPMVLALLRSKHLGRASGETPQPVYNSPTPC